MKIFDGLYLYEIVLLVLGVLFFLILLFVLLYSVIKKHAIKSLVFFFLIPIMMIGYPSIQQIKYGNLMIIIGGLTDKVEQDPTDTKATAELAEKLSEIKRRPFSSQNALTNINNAEGAVKIANDMTAIKKLTDEVRQNPANTKASKELVEKLSEIKHRPTLSKNALKIITEAQKTTKFYVIPKIPK